jgi:hypothetical protein
LCTWTKTREKIDPANLGPASIPFLKGSAHELFIDVEEDGGAFNPKVAVETLERALDKKILLYSQPVHGEFIKSRGNRCLVQPATVLLPAIRGKAYRGSRSARIRQAAV